MGSYRDLQDRGLRELDRPSNRYPIPKGTTTTDAAVVAWAEVREQLRAELPVSTWGLWIAPCELVGEHKAALVLTGPPWLTDWVRSRWATRIARTVREHTDFAGLFVCDKEAA